MTSTEFCHHGGWRAAQKRHDSYGVAAIKTHAEFVTLAIAPFVALASHADDEAPSSQSSASLPHRVELRRQASEKATPDETTKTTVRIEKPVQGTITRVRLDLQFPDEKTTFAGDPFAPRMGDTKLRAYFRTFKLGGTPLSSDTEFTFPTADDRVSGQGKYQVSYALHSVPGAPDFTFWSGSHQVRYQWDLRQTVSVAGDPGFKNINHTKPEFALRDTFGSRWLKLTFKPTIDWVQDGKTAAVGEVELGWNANALWRFSVMGGASLWGHGVPGTYHRRLELVAGRAF